jgi:hypothetical protein
MSDKPSRPPAEERIPARLRSWLTANHPDLMALLAGDPNGERLLAETAQRIQSNLNRAEVVQADPSLVDPARGDQVYLMPRPEGVTLEEALIGLIGADRDYWTTRLRFLAATSDPTG